MTRQTQLTVTGMGFITFCLYPGLCLPPPGSSNPISSDPIGSDNAADHYSRAFELLKFPEAGELKEETYAIVKNGWLQARRCENQEKFAMATDLYLASLLYARHLTGYSTSLSKMMGYIISYEAFKGLKPYLHKAQFEKQPSMKIVLRLLRLAMKNGGNSAATQCK